jgi:hypothetical protein
VILEEVSTFFRMLKINFFRRSSPLSFGSWRFLTGGQIISYHIKLRKDNYFVQFTERSYFLYAGVTLV